MRRFCYAVLFVSVLASVAGAAAPVAKVSVIAPQKLIAGDTIILDSSASTGAKMRLWSVLEPGPDGRDMIVYQPDDPEDIRPHLGPFAGSWTVQLQVIGDSPRESHKITVPVVIPGSNAPCPPLTPCPQCPDAPPRTPGIPPLTPPLTPIPEPHDPVDHEGMFGLAPKVRDAVLRLVATDYQGFAVPLSDVYRGAAQMVIKGELTPLNAAGKLKAMNAAVLKTEQDRAAWDTFSKWIGAEMLKLAGSGRLTSAKDVVQALAEISLGLSLVAAKNIEEAQ